ncbi:hypothetical protein AURDEDRAFT_113430 [Auricularia subglabra TFB-10046 SS5]|nr:hypothetical protein AURDEDRAFT_113430 [Auricularia subglabra TFB-10046 SS5]
MTPASGDLVVLSYRHDCFLTHSPFRQNDAGEQEQALMSPTSTAPRSGPGLPG